MAALDEIDSRPAMTPALASQQAHDIANVFPDLSVPKATELIRKHGSMDGAMEAYMQRMEAMAFARMFPQLSVDHAEQLLGQYGSVEAAVPAYLEEQELLNVDEADDDDDASPSSSSSSSSAGSRASREVEEDEEDEEPKVSEADLSDDDIEDTDDEDEDDEVALLNHKLSAAIPSIRVSHDHHLEGGVRSKDGFYSLNDDDVNAAELTPTSFPWDTTVVLPASEEMFDHSPSTGAGSRWHRSHTHSDSAKITNWDAPSSPFWMQSEVLPTNPWAGIADPKTGGKTSGTWDRDQIWPNSFVPAAPTSTVWPTQDVAAKTASPPHPWWQETFEKQQQEGFPWGFGTTSSQPVEEEALLWNQPQSQWDFPLASEELAGWWEAPAKTNAGAFLSVPTGSGNGKSTSQQRQRQGQHQQKIRSVSPASADSSPSARKLTTRSLSPRPSCLKNSPRSSTQQARRRDQIPSDELRQITEERRDILRMSLQLAEMRLQGQGEPRH